MDYEHIKLGNNNFFASFFAYPLAPRKEKCACGLLKEQKEAFKISSFFCSPVINQGHIYKVIELQTNIQEAQLCNHVPTKCVINSKNQWIYLKWACCRQLNLVFCDCVNQNCTEITAIVDEY